MHSFAGPFEYFTTYYHTDHFAVGSLLATGRKPVGPYPHADNRHRTHVVHNGHHTPALRGTRDRGCHDVRQGTHPGVGRLVASNRPRVDDVM